MFMPLPFGYYEAAYHIETWMRGMPGRQTFGYNCVALIVPLGGGSFGQQ